MHYQENATRNFLHFKILSKFKLLNNFLKIILSDTSGRMNCPLDPFFVLPDSCKCVDSQTLKLQETPENVPNGEIPRHITLYMDRYLCDKIVPGNRVTVTGIYSIKRVGGAGKVTTKIIL